MKGLRTTDFPQLVLLTCDTDATDWHVMRSFDPDQREQAIREAKDCLGRLRDGTQVAIAEIRTYGTVDYFGTD